MQELLTRKKWDIKAAYEMRRVKELPNGQTRGWVIDNRNKDDFFEEDPVDKMAGIGPQIKKKLNNIGIYLVKELAYILPEEIEQYVQQDPQNHLNKTQLKSLWKLAREGMLPGQKETIDYRKADNPYQARYGDDWENEIKKVVGMSKFKLIEDFIEEMFEKTADAYKGTIYEDNFMIYHDALSQMTTKETQDWMQEKGYLDRWILPVLGCNDMVEVEVDGKTLRSQRMSRKPPGNQPEMSALDMSLNADTDYSLATHVALTTHLDRKVDPRKFSIATPKDISFAIARLWHPDTGVCPKSHRIIHDIRKTCHAITEIVKHDGKIVPGLANRNGHRNVPEARTQRRYYPRKRVTNGDGPKTLEEMGIHPDAIHVAEEQYRIEREKFLDKLRRDTAIIQNRIEITYPDDESSDDESSDDENDDDNDEEDSDDNE